jgi:hypothetical protein
VIPRLLLLVTLAILPVLAGTEEWKDFRFLIGDWVGEGGGGSTGQGSGTFSFRLDIAGKVLIRRNVADYPAANGKPAIHHEDLMMIYAEAAGKTPEAVYVDSEGHVIHYESESSAASALVRFTSLAAVGAPRYRLTYRQTGEDTLAGQFEVAPPDKPDTYATYLTWTAKRKHCGTPYEKINRR